MNKWRENMKNTENRINELREVLEYHSRKYYIDDAPEISDFEYDALMNELKSLEAEFPQFFSPSP